MDTRTLQAYVFAFIAMALFTFESVLIRQAGPDLNVAQITIVRAALQLVALFIWRRGSLRHLFSSERPGLHVSRGVLSAFGAIGYFYAFANLPLSLATVVFFTSVIFTTMAARPVLGEHVGWRRWTATLVGFGGILLVLRPGAVEFTFPLLIAIVLAINASAINLATKRLTRTERPETIMAYIGVVTLLLNLPGAVVTWTPLSWPALGVMLLISTIGVLAQYVSIRSVAGADASAVAPVAYLRIVLAGIFGFWMFGERMDELAIVGSALVAGSALFITLRETMLRRPQPTTPQM